MFDIVGKRFWFFLISSVVILVGVISLGVFGLKTGIEFSSGSMMTVSFEQEVSQDELRPELASLGYTNAIIQRTGQGDYFVRTQELSAADKAELEAALAARFGTLDEREFSSVSPMIAAETANSAAIAVAVAAVGILLYITWAFRRMPKPLHYGVCAIVALVHDALIAFHKLVRVTLSKLPAAKVTSYDLPGVFREDPYSIHFLPGDNHIEKVRAHKNRKLLIYFKTENKARLVAGALLAKVK